MNITKVTTDMIHPELRGIADSGPIKTFSSLLQRKWGFMVAKFLTGADKGVEIKGLYNSQMKILSNHDGPLIDIRIYKPEKRDKKLPVVVYYHGGGYAIGSPENSHDYIEEYIKRRPCIVVAPRYRLSMANPFPAGFNDAYDTLLWVRDNMDTLGGNGKIIVGGHSAGGGMTAAVTLKARDTGDVKIAFQMPIYPMLDHTHNNPSSKLDAPLWGVHANILGWDFYLADLNKQGAKIPPHHYFCGVCGTVL